MGVQIPQREVEIFGGCPGRSKALAIFGAAVASRYRVRYKTDHFSAHSVCQASANRNPENFGRRRCGLSAGNGWWKCTARAKSDIYDSLVSSMPAVFPTLCGANSEKCLLLWHHFHSKIVTIRTFSLTIWFNFIRITRQIFTT